MKTGCGVWALRATIGGVMIVVGIGVGVDLVGDGSGQNLMTRRRVVVTVMMAQQIQGYVLASQTFHKKQTIASLVVGTVVADSIGGGL